MSSKKEQAMGADATMLTGVAARAAAARYPRAEYEQRGSLQFAADPRPKSKPGSRVGVQRKMGLRRALR